MGSSPVAEIIYLLEIVLPDSQHTQRKLLNFENWCSGELLKIGHHFSLKLFIIDVIIKCQKQKMCFFLELKVALTKELV